MRAFARAVRWAGRDLDGRTVIALADGGWPLLERELRGCGFVKRTSVVDGTSTRLWAVWDGSLGVTRGRDGMTNTGLLVSSRYAAMEQRSTSRSTSSRTKER